MTKQKQCGLRQTKIELAASFKHLSNYKNKIITRLKMLQKTTIPTSKSSSQQSTGLLIKT